MVLEDQSIFCRVRGALELSFPLHSKEEATIQKAITKAVQDVSLQVSSESFAFNIRASPVFIWPNRNLKITPAEITPDTSCREIQKYIRAEEEESDKRSSRKKEKKRLRDIININLMMEISKSSLSSVPTIHQEHKKHLHVEMNLPIDVVILVQPEQKLGVIVELLMREICNQLSDMEKSILKHMKETCIPIPQPFHFLLPEPIGMISVIYPAGVPDDQLTMIRKELHNKFHLPEDRPYLRRANAYHFPDERYKDGYLRSPHLFLSNPNLEDSKLYLVNGVYSYHHYMQDRMDDNGWGCAYRSLQTVCSWFKYQGYTDKSIPTHKEIQQALVDVGDKPKSFIGSRQWIGSIEVQAVLDHLLGITSKILFVSQGSELASKGRELANHFSTEGTPVMIGGGVLAHTILGVAWSETTGQIKYLILDPHYTGAEDLNTILDKGWCGWKASNFWDQNAYYNLCMPQRPKVV
ncbi:ufm1-specific protease 2 [Polypterus senegalus]|uniref:ufm1-specific protease 2 n=1 Tax=Polypterus senegalus TaxID=55291 RepID=UPI00196485DB|nr:ufm1-specific protease 2 [Polypterus senegalus]